MGLVQAKMTQQSVLLLPAVCITLTTKRQGPTDERRTTGREAHGTDQERRPGCGGQYGGSIDVIERVRRLGAGSALSRSCRRNSRPKLYEVPAGPHLRRASADRRPLGLTARCPMGRVP